MAIGIDEIDDYEPGTTQLESDYSTEPAEDDILSEYLKTKGIDDPNRILFEGDDDELVERSWDSLSKEEKLNILNTSFEEPRQQVENDLTEDEFQFLNTLRQHNLTPQQYIQSLQKPTVVQEPTYSVDTLSDEDIYLLDLESRVGELNEDQAAELLNAAKANEDMFKRQVEGIRREYKEREDYQLQQEQAAQEQEMQEQFEQYRTIISGAIDDFTSVGNLDINLEDDDKEDLAAFILSNDQNGANYLLSALQDPQTLVKTAWFILNGDDAFDSVSDYFKDQIKKVSEAQYRKGYEDAINGTQPKRQVVIQSTPRQNKFDEKMSIDDVPLD